MPHTALSVKEYLHVAICIGVFSYNTALYGDKTMPKSSCGLLLAKSQARDDGSVPCRLHGNLPTQVGGDLVYEYSVPSQISE